MLKETEDTVVFFCDIFIMSSISIGGMGRAPLATPMVHRARGPGRSIAEAESSRTFLASRTHFEVLDLGLEASSPRKLPVLGSRIALFFE